MTIASTLSSARYAGNGETREFPLPFRFLAPADVAVVLRAADGNERVLAEGAQYEITGAGLPQGGTCRLATPPATGEVLSLTRAPRLVQETDYQENDAFPAETHEAALDQLTMICQALDEKIARAPLVKVSAAARGLSLGDPAPGRALVWGADGLALEPGPEAGEIALAQGYAAQAAQSVTRAETARDASQAARQGAEAARDEAAALAASLEPASIARKADISAVETGLMSLAMKQAVQAGDTDRSILMNGWLDPLTDAGQVALTGMEFQSGDTGFIQPSPGGTNLAVPLNLAGAVGSGVAAGAGAVKLAATGSGNALTTLTAAMLSNVGMTDWTTYFTNLVSGTLDDNGPYFNAANVGFVIDLGVARTITGAGMYGVAAGAGTGAVCTWAYADAATGPWTSVATDATYGKTGWTDKMWTAVGAHRFWRCLSNAGTSNSLRLSEIRLYERAAYPVNDFAVFSLPTLDATYWTALKAATGNATTPDGCAVYAAVSFNGKHYLVWTGTTWRGLTYENNGVWQYFVPGVGWANASANDKFTAFKEALVAHAQNKWPLAPQYAQWTTDICAGGTAASGTAYSPAANAFDNNTATRWETASNVNTDWLHYTLPKAKRAWKATMRCDSGTYGPTNVVIYGSNDGGATKTTLLTLSGLTWANGEKKEWVIPKAVRGDYTTYGFSMQYSVDNRNIIVHEAEFYEEIQSSEAEGETQICVGGTASASLGTAANAFDNDEATFWRTSSTTNGWLRYDWPTGRRIWRYRFKTYPNSAKCPKNWTFEGSNDGTTWTVLDTRTGVTDYGETVVWRPYYEIPEANRGVYKMYRLNVSECVNASHDPALTELEMNESTVFLSATALVGLTQEQWASQAGFVPGTTKTVDVMAALTTSDTAFTPELNALGFTVDRTTGVGTAEFSSFEAVDPDIGRAVFVMQAVDTITLDTDVKAWMRRGVGAYAQVPLVQDSAYDATRVLVRGELDMSATPGTAAQLKLTTHNNKAVKVFQAANYFKSK
ncbi:MAG: discoidin domain-containing protein [Desulfovibrio aminophilus]|uniref:discoidin domain-containing protein n=1 Tax=Desulfovibrio aminophilus TaxID=81425 RepID=UPI0039ECC6B8